ncbi:MAG: hypothetical protein LBR50_00290 [Tannerella sp.]|nr:hypothetical protein [Tannerella sp.]
MVTKVWKNYEELYTLYEERFTGSWRSWMGQGVYDMYIDNGDVYVAGRYVEGPAGNEQFTSLWKNGEPMYTSDVEHQGFSVHVENGTIYTAGIANNYEDANCAPSTGLPGVTLWTNGNPQLLYLDRKYGLDSTYTSTVGPTALIVRNGIAYVGGNVSFNDATAGTFISTAKIWSTDGNNIDLIEHGPTSANALPTVWALYNYNGIYAAVGDEVPSSWDLYAYLWNSSSDDMIELPDIKNATTPSAAPNAIFIVPPSMPIQGLTRQVILKVSDDFVSSKPSGVYYVDSRSDFTFTVTPKGNGVKAVLSTSRIVDDEEKNYKITPRTDGSYDITVYGVNSPLTITVGVEEAAAAEAVAALKVYAAGSQLVIDAPTAGAAQIYSESGALVKTVSYGAGQTTVALSKGIYVITVGKTTAKVVIN